MQIYELAYKKLNEDVLTPQQIEKIFVDVETASARQPAAGEPLGPIDSAAELSPQSLFNKGVTALGRLGRPKIKADRLRTTWAGMRSDPTTENLSRMLVASGVSPKVVRDTLRRNVPQGPANPNPTRVRQPSAAPAPAAPAPAAPAAPAATKAPVAPPPAPAPTAPKYASPQQVVDALMKDLPKDWLPEITSELLKRQRVSATKK
jgi:hypothetical protein